MGNPPYASPVIRRSVGRRALEERGRVKRMKRALTAVSVVSLLVGLAVVAAACGGSGSSTSGGSAGSHSGSGAVRVALVLDGPVNDGGWGQLWKEAGDKLQREVPGTKVTVVPMIAPGAAAQRTFRALASQGQQLIVGTGAGMDVDIRKVAASFPKTHFAAVLASRTAPNMAAVNAAIEQGRYLDGIVAGSVSKTGVIGQVEGFAIPFTQRAIDGLTLGARAANPKAQVKVLSINSWYDPAKERQAAQALVDQRADVLSMNLNTPAVPAVAKASGAGLIGYATSRKAQVPSVWLSTFTFDWSVYLAASVKQIQAGDWKATDFYGDLADGTIKMAPFGARVPAAVVAKVERAKADIIAGKIVVFRGPLNDSTGKQVVAAGSSLTTPQQLVGCCTWLAEGATGQ
ncbi:MAG TPA: BMP family ABC transporter substrate-binding protein [Conexibacter sp.]|nr:BMP family ABC transporter substrate-binding protein [Conexibacter sp.]